MPALNNRKPIQVQVASTCFKSFQHPPLERRARSEFSSHLSVNNTTVLLLWCYYVFDSCPTSFGHQPGSHLSANSAAAASFLLPYIFLMSLDNLSDESKKTCWPACALFIIILMAPPMPPTP